MLTQAADVSSCAKPNDLILKKRVHIADIGMVCSRCVCGNVLLIHLSGQISMCSLAMCIDMVFHLQQYRLVSESENALRSINSDFLA